ncbi:MAG TPA: hypothetical protein VH854_17650 [Thermoanaerobaculia bacterium]|nr:hypothetical protein [Thermoanaerobaculia bacterium]
MPRRAESLLRRLEEARHLRPGARETERLLREAAALRPRSAEELIRMHETVLFLRAYPHSPRVLRICDRLLDALAGRVAELSRTDADTSAFDEPEVAGIGGTTIGTDFSFELSRRLAARHGRAVRIDWDAAETGDRMRASWPEFVPLLEEEALADANVPYLDWLAAAAGPRRSDPRWLLDRYGRMPLPRDVRAELFDSMGVPISWNLGLSRDSRTRMRRPGPRPFFHDAPLLARRDVSLDDVMRDPRMPMRRLSRAEGERFVAMVQDATAARYREFYTFTHADPTSVVAARPGRGIELFLVGVTPDRRLPLRAAYGGFVVKNAVPIGYIEGLAFFERLEIGFNMYYTFREGESAWIYAQVLKLHRDALGVTSFSIDPYQLGFENHEAIDSGAFWFYRKLGFRPTDRDVAAAVAREERRIAERPGYRSSRATLRRLVVHNLLYEAPGTASRDWDRFHVRRIGLAVNRRMRERGGDARRLRESAESRVARALGLRGLSDAERRAFAAMAPALDAIGGLARWTPAERRAAAEIVRAKAGHDERRYLRLMQRHRRLREAWVGLGSR